MSVPPFPRPRSTVYLWMRKTGPMEVIVPDDQLSLAIGKNGQNVRLAVKLTGWKIDVKSESIAATQEEEGHRALMKIPNMMRQQLKHLFNQV